MNSHEPDVLIVYENLFKACERGLLSRELFFEAQLIYNELNAVRNKLNEVETSLPIGR